MTEDRKAAWISLDIASHAYRHNLDDPNKWALFRRALDNFHRAYKEAEEQYRDQRSSSETIG